MRLNKKHLTLVVVICAAACIFSYAQETGSFTDSRDGHEYKTIKIGDQWWMSENLAYQTSDGYFIYESIDKYLEIYGYLYTWETALQACPDGWHLPSDAEFAKLARYLGGESEAGGKVKETGNTHWDQPNTGATNSSGFTALPAGYMGSVPYKYFVGKQAYFWSYDETIADTEIARALYYKKSDFTRYVYTRETGLSVRCLKDQ